MLYEFYRMQLKLRTAATESSSIAVARNSGRVRQVFHPLMKSQRFRRGFDRRAVFRV